MGDEVTTESGEGSVSEAIFADTTPIAETFEEGELPEESTEEGEGGSDVEEEVDSEEELEEDGEHEEGEEIKPANFTDLEAANKHIAKLNRENARRRSEGKQYDEVFGQFNPEVRDGLLGLVSELANDPEAGARQLIQVAKNILGEDALVEPEIDENKPMTLKEFRELQAKEESKKQEAQKAKERADEDERAVKAIFTKAEELGYKDATADRHLLFSIAAADGDHGGTSGDLEKAHEKVAAFKQSIIDEYINGKSDQARAFPITGEGAQPATTGNPPKNWNDFVDQATEMANAHLHVGE